MNKTELKKLLAAGEWNDVEFKEARSSVPRSAYETVAAFANTHGGHLVFGVAQRDNAFEITGDVFGDDSRLWEPGEKEVRNPAIAMAMRRIAMCEQAGTGLRMMRETWRKLGHPSPTYENDRTRKAFELFIPDLDKEVDMASDLMQAMFSVKTPTQPPTQSATQSSDPVTRLLAALLHGEMASGELREALGIKHRPTFRENYLHPAIEAGLIEYTIPHKPNSRLQKYRLTGKGRQTLASEPTTGDGGGNG